MASRNAAKMDLEELLKDSSKSPLAILEHIHDHKLHEPAIVLKLGLPLRKSKLAPSQLLSVLEQIIIAALHQKEIKLASETLSQVKASTGSSSLRYRKLLALCLESAGEFEEALVIYNDMLSDNKANVHALKRKYSILRTQLKDIEARECLNDYLEQNGSDAQAWVEMAKTCLEQGDYKGATFCYEEVVLCSPMDTGVHCSLGELYVTIGGKENFVLARKHFAQCLELEKGCIRAMFGLVSATECYLDLMASDQSSSSGKKKGKDAWDEQDVELVRDLKAYGVENLIKSFKGTSMSGLVTTILSSSGAQ
jgi:tetratricopeptide (TPR) repeat protein